ncbi:dyslexia-associated protein KIAA0319-like protein [Neocloeon triangulifer]|uniref:dyslexia-associated protein KIAA0319-like protein n=1 Tax=Neocloeon triangulifer TaxID=2078957 RepID=UPI00286F7A64|nr:dyslexia-associated protein KIAA0319-like protein [Neocloeon triangulifer]
MNGLCFKNFLVAAPLLLWLLFGVAAQDLDTEWAENTCRALQPHVWKGCVPAGNTTAGTFSKVESVVDLGTCIDECCKASSCNVVFFFKKSCFLVECASEELCAPSCMKIEKYARAQMVLIRPVLNPVNYDNEEMMADSSVLLPIKSCEIGVIIDCSAKEVCIPSHPRGRGGTCQCKEGWERNQGGDCVQQTSTGLPPLEGQRPSPATEKHLSVSVMSKEIRLPVSEVDISAYTVPAEGTGEHYNYKWELVSQPADSTGNMQNAASSKLSLTHLSEGLYQFRVTVTGSGAQGEAFANVSVLPEQRENQAPVAVITPERQTIKLPISEAVLDASSSKDDEEVVSYHWELTQGPLGYAPTLTDSPTLQLHNLSFPGNYSFRLTVKDRHGASSQAQAQIIVIKETDYPPEANAGQDVIIYLPQNALTLNGNQSKDDRGISSWEWTKNSTSKAVDMQDTRTPYLKLSDLEVGVYTFVLKVTDTAGQSSSAEVHVFVKEPLHLPPSANAGGNKTIALPKNWVILGSEAEREDPQTSYKWIQEQGPLPAKFDPQSGNSSRVNATGLTRGIYLYRLVVTDMSSGSSVNETVYVTVLQNQNDSPKANAGGDLTVSLPISILKLNGSKSSDDLAVTKWKWSRDGASLAQGTVLDKSDSSPILMLSGVVAGQYVFRLKVEDEQGLSSEDVATVIVNPDPQLMSLVRLTLGAASRTLRQAQLESLLKQITLLLHGGASIIVRSVDEEQNTGRATITFLAVRQASSGVNETLGGPQVVKTLRAKLRQDPSLLDLPVAMIETVVCQNNCSNHGTCDEATRQCLCEAFWMQDLFAQYFGDGDSNCDWSILYVVVAVTAILLGLCGLSWAAFCALAPAFKSTPPPSKRSQRRKASYSLLGSHEEDETSLTKISRRMSLSEASDTDSDVLFETRSKSNGSANGKLGRRKC